MSTAQNLLESARTLSKAVDALPFAAPITHVYNPLDYAWDAYAQYVKRGASAARRVLFLGMNPGPWGMAQVGVPFGEVSFVRDWMGIDAHIGQPAHVHPKRPIEGFACTRSEVSGRRLWGFFAQQFASADAFFEQHFVSNYCPLVFMEESGRNFTPDKLPAAEKQALFAACDTHLRETVEILKPEWVAGIGAFAAKQCKQVLATPVEEGRVKIA